MHTMSGTVAQTITAGPPHATRRSSLSPSAKPHTPNSSTKEIRRKRSKSVTFSGVDIVFELDLPKQTVASRAHSRYTSRDDNPSRPRKKHFSMPLARTFPSQDAIVVPSHSQRRRSVLRMGQDDVHLRASRSRERRRTTEQRNANIGADSARAEYRGRCKRLTRSSSVDHKPKMCTGQVGRGRDVKVQGLGDFDLIPLGNSASASSKLERQAALFKLAGPYPPAVLSVAAPASRYRRHTHSNTGVLPSHTGPATPREVTWPVYLPLAPSLCTSYQARPRTYNIRALELSQSGCVTMLDARIDRLIPSSFHPLPTFKPLNIMLQKSSGKGVGLFSQGMVYPGEVVLAEHPVLVLPYAVDAGVHLKDAYEDMLSRISARTRQDLLYLSQAIDARSEPTSAHDLISGITPFAIPLSVPSRNSSEVEMHRGVFLQMSRCNHSCGPNAVWQWSPESFSLALTAVRHINPGEEVTIAYTNVALPQHERRFNLQRSFGFRCTCEWCALDHRSILKSDAARFFLSTFWESPSRPSFNTWCQQSFYPADTLILDHQRALRYIQREGLETLSSILPSTGIQTSDVVRHIDAIAACYAALEDVDKFAIWTKRAAEARETFAGLGPDRKLVFSKWLSNPTCFPVWGAKNSARF